MALWRRDLDDQRRRDCRRRAAAAARAPAGGWEGDRREERSVRVRAQREPYPKHPTNSPNIKQSTNQHQPKPTSQHESSRRNPLIKKQQPN